MEITSHETNLLYLNRAVSAYLKHQKICKTGHEDPATHGTEGIVQDSCKRRKLQGSAEPEGFHSVSRDSSLSVIKTKQLETIPYGPSLLEVLPEFQVTNPTRTAGSNYKGVSSENEDCCGELHCARKTSIMNRDSGSCADQKDPERDANSLQTVICTNDLLDCVLNPQVISLMARLLLERQSV